MNVYKRHRNNKKRRDEAFRRFEDGQSRPTSSDLGLGTGTKSRLELRAETLAKMIATGLDSFGKELSLEKIEGYERELDLAQKMLGIAA